MVHPKNKARRSFHWFTLIELVVVITILAILGTIGFLSVGGYSSRGRDSARVADVANVAKSLDLSIITTGSYPTPDNAFSVTYSGGAVWTQGTVSNGVIQQLHSSISGGGMDSKPTDPLKNTEYVYSTLTAWKAYQIKVDYENDVATALGTQTVMDTAYAAPGDPTISYVRGNFGWLVAKTTTGSMVYTLAIPSIITNSWTTAGGTLNISSLSGTLVFNGKATKNSNSFNPGTVVFSGAKVAASDTWLPTSSAEILNMMTLLQNAYSGSDIKSYPQVASLVNTSQTSLVTLGENIVKSQLWGQASGGGGGSGNLVNGDCAWIPGNARYFNNAASYTLTGAAAGTSLNAVTAGYFASPTANTCQYKCASGFDWSGTSCVSSYTGGAGKGWHDIKTWWDTQTNGVIYIGSSLSCPMYRFDKTSSFVFGWTSSCDTTWASTSNSSYSSNCGVSWTSLAQTGCGYANPIIYDDYANNGTWYLSINNGGHGGNACTNSWQTISAGKLCNVNGGGDHVAGYNWYMWK